MEQLLNFLLEYGLFVGIVILTVVLIWVTYIIYNAIVRANMNRVHTTPVVTEKTPVEDRDNTIETIALKSPSLEGEGVIKTGPRKMSFDDTEDVSPVVMAKPTTSEEITQPQEEKVISSEKPVESNKEIQPKMDNEPVKSAIEPLLNEQKAVKQDFLPSSIQTSEIISEAQKSKTVQRRIILPTDDEDEAKTVKPKPQVKKPSVEKKVEDKKPAVVQKGIIVQKPKPKKKVPPKFHVLYRATDNSWYVKVEGNDSVIGTLETQREAISYATIKALKSDSVVIVHRKDGKIRKQATMKDVTDSEEEE